MADKGECYMNHLTKGVSLSRGNTALIRMQVLIVALMFLFNSIALGQAMDVLKKAFDNFSGGLIWGSLGYQNQKPFHPDFNKNPTWRGGFAALYGPIFLSGDDSDIVHLDTTITVVKDDKNNVTGTKYTIDKSLKKIKKNEGVPAITFSIGYEFSSSYHCDAGNFQSTIPLGGISISGFFRLIGTRECYMRVYGGIGGSFYSIKDATGALDTARVRFSSETTFAPELFLSFSFFPGPVHLVVDITYQSVRFSSLVYSNVSGGTTIPSDVYRRLPDHMNLSTIHFKIGVSFIAKELFASKTE